jgi:hypothetical protein
MRPKKTMSAKDQVELIAGIQAYWKGYLLMHATKWLSQAFTGGILWALLRRLLDA